MQTALDVVAGEQADGGAVDGSGIVGIDGRIIAAGIKAEHSIAGVAIGEKKVFVRESGAAYRCDEIETAVAQPLQAVRSRSVVDLVLPMRDFGDFC